MISLKDGRLVPIFSIATRDRMQNSGVNLPVRSVWVTSGSIDNVVGSTTGSVQINLDSFGFNFSRIEVFHSGAALIFDLSFENKSDNTGTNFDPRNVIADYKNIMGSDNFRSGIDQVESLVGLTDSSGSIYMRLKPYGSVGNNSFKYLIFFEGVVVYVKQDMSL